MLNNLKNHRVDPTFDFSERNVTTNDGFAQRGRNIIGRGATWKGRLLSDIRDGTSFTITHNALDSIGLSEPRQIVRRKDTYAINDQWRRGFEIAIGACEGSGVDGPGQERVKSSLVGNVVEGFEAGQEVQFNRTNPLGIVTHTTTSGKTSTLALAKPPGVNQTVLSASATGVQALGVEKPKSGLAKQTISTAAGLNAKTVNLGT
jgi:hypothetical protein